TLHELLLCWFAFRTDTERPASLVNSDRVAPQEPRRRAAEPGGLLDEIPLHRRQAIDQAEADIAYGAHRAEIVREHPVQHIGRDAHLDGIEATPALVTPQDVERADLLAEPIRLHHYLGEGGGILEAEIEALPGDRVDAVRGIAREREARRHIVARQRQPERPGPAGGFDADFAQLQTEAELQFMFEDDLVFGHK